MELLHGNLRACDVTILQPAEGTHYGALVVRKWFAKTHKGTHDHQRVLALDHPCPCPLVPLVSTYAHAMGYTLGDPADERDLFPCMLLGDDGSTTFTSWTDKRHGRSAWLPAAQRLLTEAGVPDARQYTGHSFRRTAVTMHALSDLPRDFSMKALGWSSSVIEGYDGRSTTELCRQYFRICNRA